MGKKRSKKDAVEAVGGTGQASDALAESAASGSRRHPGRTLILLLVALTLALVLSEGLRSKVLDLMFGAEEEFDYSSTTTPSTPAPAGVAGD